MTNDTHTTGARLCKLQAKYPEAEQPLLILFETVPELGQVLSGRLERFGEVEQDPYVDIPGDL